MPSDDEGHIMTYLTPTGRLVGVVSVDASPATVEALQLQVDTLRTVRREEGEPVIWWDEPLGENFWDVGVCSSCRYREMVHFVAGCSRDGTEHEAWFWRYVDLDTGTVGSGTPHCPGWVRRTDGEE